MIAYQGCPKTKISYPEIFLLKMGLKYLLHNHIFPRQYDTLAPELVHKFAYTKVSWMKYDLYSLEGCFVFLIAFLE